MRLHPRFSRRPAGRRRPGGLRRGRTIRRHQALQRLPAPLLSAGSSNMQESEPTRSRTSRTTSTRHYTSAPCGSFHATFCIPQPLPARCHVRRVSSRSPDEAGADWMTWPADSQMHRCVRSGIIARTRGPHWRPAATSALLSWSATASARCKPLPFGPAQPRKRSSHLVPKVSTPRLSATPTEPSPNTWVAALRRGRHRDGPRRARRPSPLSGPDPGRDPERRPHRRTQPAPARLAGPVA